MLSPSQDDWVFVNSGFEDVAIDVLASRQCGQVSMVMLTHNNRPGQGPEVERCESEPSYTYLNNHSTELSGWGGYSFNPGISTRAFMDEDFRNGTAHTLSEHELSRWLLRKEYKITVRKK